MKRKLFALLVTLALADIARAQDGIPEPDRSDLFEINMCYETEAGSPVCTVERFPQLIRDFGDVSYIEASPIAGGRPISSLPNYPLARYHHWVLSEVLQRVQRQYADCIGRQRVLQTLLGVYPRIDDAESPRLRVVNNVREYLVPMDPIQNKEDVSRLPRKRDAIEHNEAAIASINERVFYRGLCEAEVLILQTRVAIELQQGRAAITELARIKKPKRPKR